MSEKNIHGEPLPKGYRFTAADEARLDSQDFYTHSENILPPTDVTEIDRFIAWRYYGQFLSPMRDDFLRSMAWRISRERQFIAAVKNMPTPDASLRQESTEGAE